ncbi:MAG TPA: 4-phosphoerythronate dehydrogenase [Phycisphaerae bacterium]|nr:4-phosphoerythronate dehydrogenase [Phycisphaerae bacterium]
MRILADENIPLVGEAFGPMGEVVAAPADAIRPLLVRDAQALLVRSVTPVGAALLDGSAVRFVATATIGVDHVNQEYLQQRGIAFASAEGSNAQSVAEYVFTALAVLAERGGWRFRDKALGIVGVGNIGSRVARIAEGLGMTVLRNDPPLARRTGDPKYVPIEALAEADIVTFHVPLTREGHGATYHMIGENLLSRLRRDVILLNTSRGSVADTAVLKAALGAKRIGGVVLDVWENEPNIDLELLNAVDIATPHIAGYSYDGKVNGTRMILHAFCRHFGLQRMWDPSPLMPPPEKPRLRLPKVDAQQAIRYATRAAYDIEADDTRLRAIREKPAEGRSAYFKSLRKNYSLRREFPQTTVELESADTQVRSALETLGFPVEPAS